MGLARSWGAVLDGVVGAPVEVEVHVGQGLPSVGIVGLPGASVNEARWRMRCAVQNSGYTWPDARVTVSLAPAELPKHGAGLDLPMSIAILAAQGSLDTADLSGLAFVGELALDGKVQPVRGALALAVGIVQRGITRIVVPMGNSAECGVLPGIDIYPVESLGAALEVLGGRMTPMLGCAPETRAPEDGLDIAEVVGHSEARWALEVAAAGRHHMMLVGSPGVGKSMLVHRLPGLLPDLDDESSREVTAIHSVAGLVREHLVRRPPFQSPHASASAAAILGTIRRSGAVPGALTLAHRGVLFLDEAPEFSRDVLEGLRQPMESRTVALHRAGWIGTLPADVQLVIASNPCPCGFLFSAGADVCTCGPTKARAYQARLSGPLRNRIDIGVHMTSQGLGQHVGAVERSVSVRERVRHARERAAHRLRRFGCALNSEVPGWVLADGLDMDDEIARVMSHLDSRGLRGVHRVLRVAWTIADLNERSRPSDDDVDRAIGLYGAAQLGGAR